MSRSALLPAVRCDGLVHIYRLKGTEVVALRGVDLQIDTGQTVGLLGPSGSGKSTLMALMAGFLRPSAGRLQIGDHDVNEMTERDLLTLRAREVGVVFQNPARNLLPYASAVENVVFAQRAGDRPRRGRRRHAGELLDAVGLRESHSKAVRALSGGEQQRVAVATALANDPRLLLADEPTSQLDHDNSAAVVELLQEVNREFGTTVVLVTHDPEVGAAMQRTVTIRDGLVGSEGRGGEQFAVVGPNGTLQLPPEALEVLPPGSLARLTVRENGVDLRFARRGGDG